MRLALISFAAFVLQLGVSAGPLLVVSPPNGHVRLNWNYDTNLLSTNLWFNWYETTNISTPTTNWMCFTNVLSSSITNISGSNVSISLDIVPGQHFFLGTASNFWGETSITSTIAFTPPLPVPINDTVRIEKEP